MSLDHCNIVNNPSAHLRELGVASIRRALLDNPNLRPVANLMLALNF